MKRTCKKLLSVIMAMALCLGMCVGAMAVETTPATVDVTVDNQTNGHSYDAYQVLTGTQAAGEAAAKPLGEVKWGDGINVDSFIAEIKTIKATVEGAETAIFADVDSTDAGAAKFADVLKNYGNDSDVAKAVAKAAQANKSAVKTAIAAGVTSVKLVPGYYLFCDTTTPAEGATDTWTNLALLQVTDKITIAQKNDVPSVDKKIKDVNDSTKAITTWQDSADHDLKDHIEYQLTGTLPTKFAEYKTYSYTFNDTLSKGLTYCGKEGSGCTDATHAVKVYVVNKGEDGKDVETDVTSSFDIQVGAADDPAYTDGSKLTIACKAGTNGANDIKSIPNVTIDKDTKIVVRYRAMLNENAVVGSAGNPNEVNLTYSNNPNAGGEGDTGTTPDDKVIDFTFKTVVNKVDENSAALEGAGFTLYKFNGTDFVEVENGKAVADSSGNVVTDGSETQFSWTGLDDGIYKLVESKIPNGYNKIDDIFFEITAEHDKEKADPTLTTLTFKQGKWNEQEKTFTAETDAKKDIFSGEGVVNLGAGTATTTVQNKKGATLPGTGGIGTTIFYIVGGVLVVGAGVLLITKKRMAK